MRNLFIILAFLLPAFGIGQDHIRFVNLTIEDGLSQSSVNSITQDEQGFMWFGTQDGLNRYDGYSFRVLKSDPQDPVTISNSYVTAICPGENGSLWVGTEHGLNWYDPEKERFERYYKTPDISSIPSNRISCLYRNEADLWIGTEDNGIAKRTNGSFMRLKILPEGELFRSIHSLFKTTEGKVYAGTSGGLLRFEPKDSAFAQVQLQGISDTAEVVVWSVIEAGNTLWIGTSLGLYMMENGVFQRVSLPNDITGEEPNVRTLVVDRAGNLWAGTLNNGVYRLQQNTAPTHYKHSQFDPKSLLQDQVYAVYEDYSGNVWIGGKNGVSRFDLIKQGFQHITYEFGARNTLPDNNIWCFNEAEENKIWIGTRKGLTLFNQQKGTFQTYSRETNNLNTPNDNSVLSFCQSPEGTLWLGFVDGLFRFELVEGEPVFERVHYKDKINTGDPRVYDILDDEKGRVWVATREGLGVVDKTTNNHRFFQNDPKDPYSLPENLVRTLHKDSEGTLWVGTHGGGLARVVEEEGKILFKTFTKNAEGNGLNNNTVLCIAELTPGKLLIGTYGGGINIYDTDKGAYTYITSAEHGLANDVVYGILKESNKVVWVSTNNGLSRLNLQTGTVRNYSSKDGLQSNEFNIGAYHKMSDGRMLFGGINGFNIFHPDEITMNQIPPKVVITDFIWDSESYKLQANGIFSKSPAHTKTVTLPHYETRFSVEFSALHYTHPDQNQYKYMLEGIDQSFTYTQGADHRANYSNLPPGEYTFIVYGSNSDGVWSEEPATIKIVVDTPYWKSEWFQAIAIIIVLAVAYMFFWMQVRNIRSQKLRLQQLVEDRTREVTRQKEQIEKQKELLQQEKEKVENLLLNVLPEETAEELKSKGKATARGYRRVSIMFTDFRNFTILAEKLRPADVVQQLDSFFSKFDDVVEKFGLEKIKTIGDAYMCAGGLPVRNKENPIHTVLAALEIQRIVNQENKKQKERGETPWSLRVGINTGEVVAGVIGSKRFAYDIWGNSVNVAARMETSGEPGKVNISGKTYEYIEPYFNCTYRGKIPAKNKGHIDMYFVERIKPELSVDGLGIEPSQDFWDYVNLHLFSSINYMKAERYIMKLLEKKLSPKLHYHGIHHTRDVTEAAERLAIMEGIKGEDLFILQTAATYHDAGFVEQYDANEPVGVRMSREILPKYGYTEEQIEIISGLIYATRIPHDPQTHLQEIICDADLDYLGRDDFHTIADTLRKELREHGKINSDRLWDEIQIKFLSQHKYFTQSAIKLRQDKKMKHVEEIKERLAKGEYKD